MSKCYCFSYKFVVANSTKKNKDSARDAQMSGKEGPRLLLMNPSGGFEGEPTKFVVPCGDAVVFWAGELGSLIEEVGRDHSRAFFGCLIEKRV